MCMDHGPFLLVSADEEISLEHVSSILNGSTSLKLVDIFGKTREIPGKVAEIDLLNKRIVLA